MRPNIGIGTYLKADYPEIRSISEDKDSMDMTWKEWKANKRRLVKKLESQGFKTVDVIVKPKELFNYCRIHQLKINGESRSQFARYKMDLI